MNKPVHFRDEIRRSFIIYALVPAVIFAVILIIVSVLIWHWNLYCKASDENEKITALLERTIDAYYTQAEQPFPVPPASLEHDNSAVSSIYRLLKGYILKQQVHADFIILSPAFRCILQGDSENRFIVPVWQNDFHWGALGRMQERPGRAVVEISSDYNAEGIPELIIGRALSSGNGRLDGYLIFTVTAQNIREAFTTMLPFAVTNACGVFFLGSGLRYKDQFDELPAVYRRDAGYYFTGNEAVRHGTTEDGLFTIYTFADTGQLNTTAVMMVVLTLAVLALMIRGFFFSATKIAGEKSETIDKIVEAYKEVEDGNFDSRLHVDSNIEFQTIADAYNDMLDNLARLIEEKACETQEKYIAELKQLEMQFNPHFMYNTLENIKFLIKLDPDKARETILWLSELLRYSINNEISVVPVSEDLYYMENYLHILKMRFGERFEYLIDVTDSAASCLIPKLILQPLIGNSVRYGFENRESVCISITARAVSDRLFMSVKDNGAGMEKEKLKEIHSLLKSETNRTSHIGLYNVQRRIRLMYGNGYGVKIDSVKGEGTVARLVLPVVRNGKV